MIEMKRITEEYFLISNDEKIEKELVFDISLKRKYQRIKIIDTEEIYLVNYLQEKIVVKKQMKQFSKTKFYDYKISFLNKKLFDDDFIIENFFEIINERFIDKGSKYYFKEINKEEFFKMQDMINIKKYSIRNKKNRFFVILSLIALIFILKYFNGYLKIILIIISIFSSMLFSLIYNRCPRCNKLLGFRKFNKKTCCLNCGARLKLF